MIITSINVSQEIFAMDILKALKSSLKHHRKHVLQLLQLYGDQALNRRYEYAKKNRGNAGLVLCVTLFQLSLIFI